MLISLLPLPLITTKLDHIYIYRGIFRTRTSNKRVLHVEASLAGFSSMILCRNRSVPSEMTSNNLLKPRANLLVQIL